jgi:hypothetical protein
MFSIFTSTGASPLRTRFIIVNDRVPCRVTTCAICGRKIERGYVRESRTRLLYCDMSAFQNTQGAPGHPQPSNQVTCHEMCKP